MMKMEVYHEKPVTVDSSLNKFLIGISWKESYMRYDCVSLLSTEIRITHKSEMSCFHISDSLFTPTFRRQVDQSEV
jgi:hypothetical protein